MMPARSMSPHRTYSEMTKGVFFGGMATSFPVVEVVKGVEVIEERRRRSLDNLDDLDTLAHLCLFPVLRNEEGRQRIRNQRLVRALAVDQAEGEQSHGPLCLLHVVRSRHAIHR